MDPLSFDAYTTYSDASTPRTPSPNMHFPTHDAYAKDQPIFYRGSLLHELYEPDATDYNQQHDSWHAPQQQQQQQFPTVRRATYPYVRHDREDNMPLQQYPSFMQPHQFYEHPIKLEDTALIVPSQPAFYRPSQPHPLYMQQHQGLPVQHTDDAASKETQYLRRRCFNCHTTEPPSWRRSTLNPGKIVCNKCGLYERTHLRPRPLRFDELRAGNKARKQAKSAASAAPTGRTPSPKQRPVKKEPSAGAAPTALARRASVSSSAGSVHSGSGASDWDDNVSLYSAGSAPPTSFSSPALRANPGLSPPRPDGGIRLPNNPLSDLAALQVQQMHMQHQMMASQSQSQKAQYYDPGEDGGMHPSRSLSLGGSPQHSALLLRADGSCSPAASS